jgi:hypothetical protein
MAEATSQVKLNRRWFSVHLLLYSLQINSALVQTPKLEPSTTEDFSTWGTTYKVKWSTLVGAIVIGLIASLLARRLTPGKEAMGLITTIILGIAARLLADS